MTNIDTVRIIFASVIVMNDKTSYNESKMSDEDKLLEEFKKERRAISDLYLHGKITFPEYRTKVQECIGRALDKLNSLPKVSEMKF